MPENLCVPFYDEGDEITCFCSEDVAGKTFVKISGARQHSNPNDGVTDAITGGNVTVAQCEEGDVAFGVAAYDQTEGNLVTVYRAPKIVPVTAGEAITAGDSIGAGADGMAVAGDGAGVAIDNAEEGADAGIALTLTGSAGGE